MANLQSGAAGFTPEPSGKLYLGSDQLDLTSGSSVIVALDTVGTGFTDEIEDIGNYKITPGVAGLYLCVAQVRFKSVVADKLYLAEIRVGVAAYVARNHTHSAVAEDLTVPVVGMWWSSKTDYFQLRAVQWSGVNTVDIDAEERNTFLEIQRLR